MQTVLVTGCAGFIGSNFVHHLIDRPFRIEKYTLVGLDKMTYAADRRNIPRALELYEGDIRDQQLVENLVRKHKIDVIVNFAAESHVDRSIENSAPFLRSNVEGVRVLLEVCKKEGIKLLQISTDEVYGELELNADYRFTERTPINPRSPYSASKAAADFLALAYANTYGVDVIITRSTNNYGPRQYWEKMIPTIIRSVIAEEPIPVYGDGLYVRDWLHVDDNCRAIIMVMEEAKSGTVWNIGASHELPNIVLAENLGRMVAERINRPFRIKMVPDRPGHDRRYAVDAYKIKKYLGWQPQEPLWESMERTVDWYLENRRWVS